MEDVRETVPDLPDEIVRLWSLLLEAATAPPVDPGILMCGACGSQAFEDLTPPGAVVRLLKCLRCEERWLLAGNLAS